MKEKAPKKSQAMQRHADFYTDLLMDVTKNPEDLYIEMGQIHVALDRIKEEQVKTIYPTGALEVKFLEVSGGFVETMLPKLLRGEFRKSEVPVLEEAVKLVEQGIVEYPVAPAMLTDLLAKAKERFKAEK